MKATACLNAVLTEALPGLGLTCSSYEQGHLRLVLLPIVYNAMAEKDEMRTTGLFTALHAALQQSTYWPLLRPSECRKGLAATRRSARCSHHAACATWLLMPVA